MTNLNTASNQTFANNTNTNEVTNMTRKEIIADLIANCKEIYHVFS